MENKEINEILQQHGDLRRALQKDEEYLAAYKAVIDVYDNSKPHYTYGEMNMVTDVKYDDAVIQEADRLTVFVHKRILEIFYQMYPDKKP